MTNPLAPSSLLTPLISSAAMRAIVDDRARLQRMLDFEVALARAQAAVGIIPALATDADRRGRQRRALRYRGARRRGGHVRQCRHPADPRTHRRGGQDRCRCRRLRALGRHQPGRHRHRAGAGAAGRDRRAGFGSQPRGRGLCHACRPPSPHRRGRAHLDAARDSGAVRAQARRLCGGAGALARAVAPACARTRWCCNSAERPARSPPSTTAG